MQPQETEVFPRLRRLRVPDYAVPYYAEIAVEGDITAPALFPDLGIPVADLFARLPQPDINGFAPTRPPTIMTFG